MDELIFNNTQRAMPGSKHNEGTALATGAVDFGVEQGRQLLEAEGSLLPRTNVGLLDGQTRK
jgi:hypothetical protein